MEKEIIDLQPTLKGDLIDLRPLRPDDFDELLSAASDPLIWEQHPECDRYKREVFQKFFDGALESKGAFVDYRAEIRPDYWELEILQSGSEERRSRDRLDFSGTPILGRNLQSRVEETNARSRLSICRSRPLRRWRKEPSIAKSAGKDRRQISKESASSRS